MKLDVNGLIAFKGAVAMAAWHVLQEHGTMATPVIFGILC